jgi:hypothetical protein
MNVDDKYSTVSVCVLKMKAEQLYKKKIAVLKI